MGGAESLTLNLLSSCAFGVFAFTLYVEVEIENGVGRSKLSVMYS